MVTYLEKNLPALKDNIISADFLDIDLRTVFGGEPFILIGNFPYNISSQILIKAMETSELIPEVVGMFQKEVGERVCAKPSTSDYNGLTVQMQAFYTTEYLFSLPPEAFNPPPKVFSGVIRLVRLDREWDCDPVKFRKIVRQAFAQRRKMLRNTLAGLLPKETLFADDFFTRRAETLTVEDFIKLTNRIDGK
jgi:16S rRNA (adenine1518-N6/adenine1519-N6)-dimethyltransferase